MSGKLDQSLDEIVSSHRGGSARGRAGRRGRPTRAVARPAAPAGPIGGIKKTVKAKGGRVPTGPSGGDSKIFVSNLPKDVNENQIKEYVNQVVGHVKKVEISYGLGGVSRGTATIIFGRSDSAAKAIDVLNGILLDGKPMKVDVIVDAKRAAAIPPPKGLGDRITAPKAQPKSAASTKPAAGAARGGAKGKRGAARGGRAPRQAKKTAEELDSEMADYWTGAAEGDASVPAGSAPVNSGGDAPMDDEIL